MTQNSPTDSDEEVEQREKDADVAALQEREARAALERGDYLEAIEAAGSIMSFAARAADRDAPVAVLKIDRIGNHEVEEIALAPGEEKRIEIDGKAKLILSGEKRYREGYDE
ncbi:MAG: hypothetical protein ABEJ55_07670 [Halanaeroarchaeum sp.]